MLELLVLCLSLLPVALCAAVGCRAGLRRILGGSALFIACYSAFVLTLAAAFRAGWFEPLGLATPLLLGLASAAAVRLLWPFPRNTPRALPAAEGARGLSRGERAAGALAGALGGSVAALALWLLLLAVSPFAFPAPRGRAEPERPAAEESLVRALVRTANHGFIRHVPLVGPMEEEVEALVSILETDHAVRAEYIRRRDWRGIETLATFREVLADESILEDIERVRGGDLGALYRLQKNPRILAFSTEEVVLRLVRGTRPSAIAAELEAIGREASAKPRR